MKRIPNYSRCRTVPRDAKEGQVLSVVNGQLAWVDTECSADNYVGAIMWHNNRAYVIACDGELRKEVMLWPKPEPTNGKVKCNPTGRRYTQFRREPLCLTSGGKDGDFVVFQCCGWTYAPRICCVGYTDLDSSYEIIESTTVWPETVVIEVDLPECCANEPREKCITNIELANCAAYTDITGTYEINPSEGAWPAEVTLQVELPDCCPSSVLGSCIESVEKDTCASVMDIVATTEPTEEPAPVEEAIPVPDLCTKHEVVDITIEVEDN